MHARRLLIALFIALVATAPSFAAASNPLHDLIGSWQGELVYRDYGSGERVSIPARMEGRLSPDGNYLISDLAFTDPGRVVRSMEVSSLDVEAGELVSRSFTGDGVYEETLDLTQHDERDDGWEMVFTQQGQDDGRPAESRVTRTLEGDRFSSRKDVRYLDEESSEWFLRNEFVVQRVVATPEDLLGTWKVDLRPTPDAEPYFMNFVVTSVEGGSFEGTFYGGAPLSEGRVNAEWGSLVFAFTTEDGSGVYHTSGRIVGERIEGRTHSLGRDTLWVWTAERIE